MHNVTFRHMLKSTSYPLKRFLAKYVMYVMFPRRSWKYRNSQNHKCDAVPCMYMLSTKSPSAAGMSRTKQAELKMNVSSCSIYVPIPK